jgi:ribosomal protein S18 acetylase RimI-like enzyme
MSQELDLSRLCASLEPRLHRGVFVFCELSDDRVPPGLDVRFVFREDESTTVVVPVEQAAATGLAGECPSAWITLGAGSDLAAVGFLAVITARLATAGISCNVVSAFHHDHLFVPAAKAADAMSVLTVLQGLYKPSAIPVSVSTGVQIRPALLGDLEALSSLWQRCGLKFEPTKIAYELQSCLGLHGELILVASSRTAVIGSIWATYDGRRGWIQRVATDPGHRGQGIARSLLAEAEARLARLGATKVNLLIEPVNAAVSDFYATLGYASDDLLFMERLLDSDMGA